jgi:hypothetical protein
MVLGNFASNRVILVTLETNVFGSARRCLMDMAHHLPHVIPAGTVWAWIPACAGMT